MQGRSNDGGVKTVASRNSKTIRQTANAETRYISDQLVVSLREQPQKGAQSITYLKTDMAVEVLEEDGEYIKVQTEAGEVGYIKQNYLTTKTPRSAIIKQLQQERSLSLDAIRQVLRDFDYEALRAGDSLTRFEARVQSVSRRKESVFKLANFFRKFLGTHFVSF